MNMIRITKTECRQQWEQERMADQTLCKTFKREVGYTPIGNLLYQPGLVDTGQIREVPIEASAYNGGLIEILVVSKWDGSWLCLPISPYGVPGSNQEYMLMADIVGQTWNARNLSDATLRRMGEPVRILSETHVKVAKAMVREYLTGANATKAQVSKQGWRIENHEHEYGELWLDYCTEWAKYINQLQADMWV
jgi:hypothetical protein